MEPTPPSVTRLSDADLIVEVSRLAARERAATADLLAALMEFDARRLYLGEGCSSLFAYCTTRLHLSESAAYVRIEAARAARAWPLVLEHVRAGRVTLTGVKLLAPHLTDANHREVLAAAAGHSTEQIKELVAGLAPRPDVPSSIRKLPEPKPAAADGTAYGAPSTGLLPAPEVGHEASPCACGGAQRPLGTASPRPAVVQPLAPARYHLQVTVSAETRATLGRLQDLLRREIPSGDPAAIVERALGLLLAHVERQKCAATTGRRARPADAPDATSGAASGGAPPTAAERGRPAPAATRPRPLARRSRRIPAAVKREVWRRDGGQCGYVSATGQRCASRARLEYHHHVPVADGGPTTVENLHLMCDAHHGAESQRVFQWQRVWDTRPEQPGASDATRAG